MDDYAPFPFNALSATYGPWVNAAPWSYHMVYRAFSSRRPVENIQRAAYPLVRKRVIDAFNDFRPDLVISVHPIQVTIPLRVLRELGSRAPFITVVTDPVTPPVAWFSPAVDLTVVATEPAREMALACGLESERVRVIGLPVRGAFGLKRSQPRREMRSQLGLDPDRRLVLLTGGGAGIGKLLPLARAVAKELARHHATAQMAIVAGHNTILQRRLRQEPWPLPVRILGFVEDMAGWLAAADLLITKAGPGTLAEAACMGVPVLITGFIPGQEEGNITWIEQHGAGVFQPAPRRAAVLVNEWFQPGSHALDEMAAAARGIAHCDAAAEIAAAALALYHNHQWSVVSGQSSVVSRQ